MYTASPSNVQTTNAIAELKAKSNWRATGSSESRIATVRRKMLTAKYINIAIIVAIFLTLVK